MGNLFSKCCPPTKSPEKSPTYEFPPRSRNEDDIFADSDDLFLDRVLAMISGLLSFHQQTQQTKPASSVWNLPGASSFMAVHKTLDTFSPLQENGDGGGELVTTLTDVLTVFGKAHWIGVGLVVVAAVLERLESSSANKKECLALLEEVHRLAKCVKLIKSRTDLNRGIMKESAEQAMKLIIKSSDYCYAMINASRYKRFMKVATDQARVNNIKTKIDKTYRDLMMHLGIAIYDAVSAQKATDPRLRSYPLNAVGIDAQFLEVVDLLELGSHAPAIVVVLYGEAGMGKTTLAQAVYSGINVEGFKFSKICLCEHRNATPDIAALQKSIIKDLTGQEREFETHSPGQKALQQVLQDHEAFIFIDNVLDSTAIHNLLPRNLDRATKVRLLLTAESPEVVKGLPVRELRTKPMRAMAAKDAIEFMKNELKELRAEQMEAVQDAIKGLSLPPITVNVVSNVIKEADDKEDALRKVTEKMEQIKLEIQKLETQKLEDGSSSPKKDQNKKENGTGVSPSDAEEEKVASGAETIQESWRSIEKLAYDMLTDQSQKVFLDICCFFLGWEWWLVEAIVGERELQELHKKGLVRQKQQVEEEYRVRVSRPVCRVEVPASFLDMGLQLSERSRFTDVSKLDRALLLRQPHEKEQEIEGIYLQQSSSLDKGNLPARELDSFHNSLRVLSIRSSLVQCPGMSRKSFSNLIFLDADNMDIPLQVQRQKALRYLSYCPRSNVDLSKMSKDLRVLKVWGGFPGTTGLPSGRRAESIGEYLHLRWLVLNAFNEINAIPASVGKLRALRILSLAESTALKGLPVEIGNLTALEQLILDWCESLKELPGSIRSLTSLRELSLNFCGALSGLPEGLGNLTMLTKLNLKRCTKLESLPDSLQNLHSLQLLNLKGCSALKDLPPGLRGLVSLRFLYAWDCSALQSLPEGLCSLSKLTELELCGCKALQSLPRGFGHLASLRRLELQACESLSELSDDFASLPELEYLDLSHCPSLQPEKVPIQGFLLKLPKLRSLHIVDTPALLAQWTSLQQRPRPQFCVFTDPGYWVSKYRGKGNEQQQNNLDDEED